MTKKRFRKEHIKGTGMQFIVDESTRKEHSNGNVGYKAYSTTDMSCDDLVDLLNNLHEQNQNLKFLNNKYVKENKSLRVIRNSLKGIKKHIDLLSDDGVI